MTADAQGFRHKLLGHLAPGTLLFQRFSQRLGRLRLLLADGGGAQVFAQGFDEQHDEVDDQGEEGNVDEEDHCKGGEGKGHGHGRDSF